MTIIPYAKEPLGDLEVIDLDQDVIIDDVVEVNADCGWLIKRVTTGLWMMGNAPPDLVTVKGRFYIRRKN